MEIITERVYGDKEYSVRGGTSPSAVLACYGSRKVDRKHVRHDRDTGRVET